MDSQVATEGRRVIQRGSAAEISPGSRRRFSRFFNRHLLYSVLLIYLPLLFALSFREPKSFLNEADIWWHLADARILFATGHFIHQDPFAFSTAGKPWVNAEWLSEVPFWAGYRWKHLTGVFVVAWLAFAANLLLLYWRSFRETGNALAALLASVLGLTLMTVNAGPRTIVFGFLAMSAELAILEAAERGHTRQLWLLPPLFCLWINLHGSWLIGLFLLGLYIACGSFSVHVGSLQQTTLPKSTLRLLSIIAVASVAAMMINPYGWRLLWSPLDMMFKQPLNIGKTQEWEPLSLGMGAGKAALLAIVAMVAANLVRGRSWKVYEVALVLFAWYAAFDHARFTFLAAILTTPLLARDLGRSFIPMPEAKTIPMMNAAIAAGILFLAIRAVPNNAVLEANYAHIYPQQIFAAIQPSWRTMNDLSLGGAMDFEGKPTFIDTRTDLFEHNGILQDYLGIVFVMRPLEVLDKDRIDHVLILQNSSLAYLLEHSPGWSVVRREGSGEDEYVLLQRALTSGT